MARAPAAAPAPIAERPLRIGVSGAGGGEGGGERGVKSGGEIGGKSGGGSGSGDDPALAAARIVGETVARAGAVLVTGGLGGVMAAAARGAQEAGGVTVGLLPGERASDANPYIAIPVVTNLGHARNVILVHTAEALVAIGGSYGTLSEVALALKIGVPVAAVGSWKMERTGHPAPPITTFEDPAEAAAWALAAARRHRGAR